jgi:hypothetical protein
MAWWTRITGRRRPGCRAAGSGLTFATVVAEHVAEVSEVRPSRPGHLADRELPAIPAVLAPAGSIC